MNNPILPFDLRDATQIVPTPHISGTCGEPLAPQPPQRKIEGRNLILETNVEEHCGGRLGALDLSRKVSKSAYDIAWPRVKTRLHRALCDHMDSGRGLVVVLEGWDAGGKTGAATRLFEGVAPAHFTMSHTGAPTKAEKMHHFLWRFRQLDPRNRHICVFDRSWYGRVLFERVEENLPKALWMSAYDDINQYEAGLVDRHVDVIKFWLHIDFETQKKRLQDRLFSADKAAKLTDDDFRNYCLRGPYCDAANDMLAHTDNDMAPWILVPGNNKRHARLVMARALTKFLQARQKAKEQAKKQAKQQPEQLEGAMPC